MVLNRVIRAALEEVLSSYDGIPQHIPDYLTARGIYPNELKEYMNANHTNIMDMKMQERYRQLLEKSGYIRR
jgi:hypothetical protein